MADQIGDVSAFAVRKWKYGERTPRGKTLARIGEITGGVVTANDFTPASPSDSPTERETAG